MKVNFNRILLNDYDSTLIFITSLVQCKICLNILNDPYDCSCCNQTFCKKCIVNYINTNKKCPYSSYFFSSTVEASKSSSLNKSDQLNRLIEALHPSSSNIVNSINSLKFTCEYKKNGCMKELSLDEIDAHSLECKLKQTSPLSIHLNRNNNGHNTFTNNSNNNNSASIIDNLDALTNSAKDKFKFHDSCMSFRKVDFSDSSSTTLTGNQQQFNQKMMEKMDKMYEMISNMTMSGERPRSSNRKQSTKQTINQTTPMSTIEDSTSTDKNLLRESIKKKQDKKPTTTTTTIIHNNNIDNLTAKIDKIIAKISSVERILQTASSVSTQHYSIANEDLLLSTISSTPKKRITINTNFIPNTQYHNYNNTTLNHTMNNTLNHTMNNTSTTPMSLTNKTNNPFNKKKLFNKCNTLNNGTKLNMSLTSTSKVYHTITKEDKINSSIIKMGDNNINRIEELLNMKLDNIKSYIEDKCVDELRKYFLELTLDNSNLFVQKIDELINIIPSNFKDLNQE